MEVALPLTELSDEAAKYPLRDHLNALSAHLVFGSTTELTRKVVPKALRVPLSRGFQAREITREQIKREEKPSRR